MPTCEFCNGSGYVRRHFKGFDHWHSEPCDKCPPPEPTDTGRLLRGFDGGVADPGDADPGILLTGV